MFCLLLIIGTAVSTARASELDQSMNKAPDQLRDRDLLTLVAKPAQPSSAQNAQAKPRGPNADQIATRAQMAALDAQIQQLEAQLESLKARQKELTRQFIQSF